MKKETWKKILVFILVFAFALPILPAKSGTAATKIKLKVSKTKYSIEKGKSATIKVTVTPKKYKKYVTYKSSKKSVAAVKNGKITAKAAGTAKITVSLKGKAGKKVTPVVISVTVTKSAAELAAEAAENERAEVLYDLEDNLDSMESYISRLEDCSGKTELQKVYDAAYAVFKNEKSTKADLDAQIQLTGDALTTYRKSAPNIIAIKGSNVYSFDIYSKSVEINGVNSKVGDFTVYPEDSSSKIEISDYTGYDEEDGEIGKKITLTNGTGEYIRSWKVYYYKSLNNITGILDLTINGEPVCYTGGTYLRVYCKKEQLPNLQPVVHSGVTYTIKTENITDEYEDPYDASLTVTYKTGDSDEDSYEKTYYIKCREAEVLSVAEQKELKGSGYLYYCFSPKESGTYKITIGKGTDSNVEDSVDAISLTNMKNSDYDELSYKSEYHSEEATYTVSLYQDLQYLIEVDNYYSADSSTANTIKIEKVQ
ncbi:MAG: Ig-like domain-containing protein [Lachnospiraceae bacterium]|nr:Ig-like domain-containing protein [Lachnospiraceae bacterium]